MTRCDVLIIGAGAAGLFCAGVAAQQGLHVLLLDHFPKVAEKIRISGGGRSNFTNKDIDPRTPHTHFLGENPAFARSALSRYTAQDFIDLVKKHDIGFHEKHKGQLFCDRSAQDLIDILLRECEAGAMGGNVTRWQPCNLLGLQYSDAPEPHYVADTAQGQVQARAVVVASGGLSIPKIGATDIGYRLAKQFGLRMLEPRPALVPLTFSATDWQPYAALAGLSLPVAVQTGEGKKKHGVQRRPVVHPPRVVGARCTANFQLLAGKERDSFEPFARLGHGTDLGQRQTDVQEELGEHLVRLVTRTHGGPVDRPATPMATQPARHPGQSVVTTRRFPAKLVPDPFGNRGLCQSRGNRWRGGHAGSLPTNHGIQATRAVLHWRSG